MEIERINENTVKFYISYMDIEDRGFDREEIWYNRDKSEQLFWEVMDEVNEEEEFIIDGPLWIQVQAMDKGLEIVVTKAQLSKDGHKLELPSDTDKIIDLPIDEKVESLLDKGNFLNQKNTEEEIDDVDKEEEGEFESFSIMIRFQDIEHVIRLSQSIQSLEYYKDSLYHHDSSYYLFIEFEEDTLDDDAQENILSFILEFGEESGMTIHRLEEYGKLIYSENALATLKTHFPN
ncbi:adapter protein MecA 1/2 [Salirhabdus euzebyi]|uniref:Adapter protein MecA n=1 Tax=Salirhabdus euzebyi TaxID=394506 RepID=A0A841Q3R1_9BACI|nr:adaptor protein MecA [Salirhabdus euzebyi]MBB6453051.1 adapter protein MecA 1/2 [Salirhabdus euzebyi]